ncbi:sulfite exporter TauE/SafE family protein [Rhodalgimonas zhirmunskyi]|uniref:Probable membrane transporter protein n=1 Tax=Rhodalgimonas zhirmunskyi TaxID=2964767 RepID=A0AAJ1U6X4_9RHOB|nr:sulfite exporter TauE/SafE family protein [Rhodoalgimonas zhirmunskyi]MDQ2094705.1 sulfite exporter TauE/SafE family protein [Rhodoalgimonas zhirmunskyi]
MPPLDLTFFLIAGPAVAFAGVSKGGFGSGAAFAAAAILALVIEPGAAIGLMLPMLMLIDVATLRPYWGKWNKGAAKLLILGGLPGTALGAGLYAVADADVFRVLIGAISLGFVAWQLLGRAGLIPVAQKPLPPAGGLLAGAVAGLTSFISHAGGPPAAVYLLSIKPTKTEFQATTVLVFWVLNIVKFVPYAFLGIFTWDTLRADLFLAPFALAGAWLGVRAHYIVPERLFFGLTYVLLTVTGAKLIWDGLT